MNAGERAKRKKQKEREKLLHLWLPVVLVVILVTGLTAGGVALSLGQTGNAASKGSETQSQEADGTDSADESKTGSEEAQEPSGSQTGSQESDESQGDEDEYGSLAQSEAQTEIQTEVQSEADYSQEQADFDEFISNLEEAVTSNSSYLKTGSDDLTRTVAELKSYDSSHLTDEQARTYSILQDSLNIQVEGEQYESIAASSSGTALCTLEGGVEYYNYLLRKNCGIDVTWEELRETVANELNQTHQALVEMEQADSTLKMVFSAFTTTQPDSAYAYDTVTASSSVVKKNLVCSGFGNGWVEFGIIRAYLNNAGIDDGLTNYLVTSTRQTYALYGLADLSVHGGGWGQEEVEQLCVDYFGDSGSGDFGANLYQNVLKAPGVYAGAVTGYMQEVEIEAALAQQYGESYSESILMDVLFGQGPANFRLIRSWIGI